MSDPFLQVGEFQVAMEQPSLDVPQIPPIERVRLRLALVLEEVREVANALRGTGASQRLEKIEFWLDRMRELALLLEPSDVANADIVNLGKELADVEVVINGMAHEFGLPLNRIMDAVHESNMSKLDDDGKPVYDATGKVTKGPNYKKPNVAKILYPVLAAPQFTDTNRTTDGKGRK